MGCSGDVFACYFGSEQKAILAADCVERKLDVHALEDLFTLGLVRTPKTFSARIRRVPPGFAEFRPDIIFSIRMALPRCTNIGISISPRATRRGSTRTSGPTHCSSN